MKSTEFVQSFAYLGAFEGEGFSVGALDKALGK